MRPILVSLLLGAACADPDLQALQASRDQWAARGGPDYHWTLTRACFCPDDDPVEITVVDGTPTEAVRRPADGGDPVSLDPADFESWFTVDGLFAEVDDALRRADDVTVRYDPDLGYPTDLDIDWMARAIDDEVSYIARDLTMD